MAAAHGFTFKLSSLNRRDDDGVVYLCANCQVPLGDTNDWNGKLQADSVVLLKAVSEFVKCDKMTSSSDPDQADSKYHPLHCSNCDSPLGRFYFSTPPHLITKLNLYNIDSTAVKEYTLGEDLHAMIPASEAPLTLETCQYFDEEFKKQHVLLEMLQKKLSKLENRVLSPEQDS
ncbi:protein Mis18-alpha-like isoform X1 [Bufo gargarizans]|uniref:protein Mis18-alpha-like isoform X1 n=1 Tax=Bufo gargarizans TaxID=30331 RepID=UPI001CF46BF9|nr:protein Mis18-alpha-like isoform X1 [Bufo gargarizans]